MRYVTLLFAYALVALLVGLAFLFPDRPLTLAGFALVAAALTPIVGGFDVVGQGIIDSQWVRGQHQTVKPILGVIAVAAFLAMTYTVMGLIDVQTAAWW